MRMDTLGYFDNNLHMFSIKSVSDHGVVNCLDPGPTYSDKDALCGKRPDAPR
jgi:hypothetical protein